MSQAPPLPKWKAYHLLAEQNTLTRGHSASEVAKPRRHSVSEAMLSSNPSAPARAASCGAVKPRRHSISKGKLTGNLSSKVGADTLGIQAPPLPSLASNEGSKLPSRRRSCPDIASLGLLSRRGSLANTSSSGPSRRTSVCRASSIGSQGELSCKPPFVASNNRLKDDLIGKTRRKSLFKTVSCSLPGFEDPFPWQKQISSGADEDPFPWQNQISSGTDDSIATLSTRCSASNSSTVRRPSTPSLQTELEALQTTAAKLSSRSGLSSRSNSSAHGPEPPGQSSSDLETAPAPGALFEAIESSTVDCETEPLAILARPDFADLNATDYNDCLALHHAADKGLKNVCSSLMDLSSFTLVNASDRKGRTALHCAAAAGHAEVCELLLGHPRFSAADAQNIAGGTALHVAACGQNPEVCRVILDFPGRREIPKFNAALLQDDDGETALHWAAWNGSVAVCQILLEHPRFEAAVNRCDKRGRTALHSAALHGWTEACRAICKHEGVKKEVRAHDGSTALEAAMRAGHAETHRVLRELVT